MNEITTAGAISPQHDLRPGLFADFIDYIDRGPKTTRTYIVNLKQFIAWLSYRGIKRPEREDIISYRDYLATEHEAIQLTPTGWKYRTNKKGNRYIVKCKPNTIKQYMESVRRFFAWTAVNGYYPDVAKNVHTPRINQGIHRKDALTAADVQTIEKSIEAQTAEKLEAAAENRKDTAGRVTRATIQGKRLFAMYTLAVNAGLRTIEISRANVKDLEVKGGNAVLYVWGKGHAEPDTRKPLAPEVYKAIKEYLDARTDNPTGNSPLFVSTGNRSGGQRMAATTISKMLKRAMVDAGYNSERITAHTLRHTAGTGVQEITGDLYTTQKYMRHSSPVTTEIYLHNDTEKKEAETAQQLYNFFHGINQSASLEYLLKTLTPVQLKQLTSIAEMMAG